MADRSFKFIELRHYPGKLPVDEVEGAINAELEQMQKVTSIRVDTVYVKPVVDPVQGGFFYHVQISGRKLVKTHKPPDKGTVTEIPDHINVIPAELIIGGIDDEIPY
jgi:hypothetical protein